VDLGYFNLQVKVICFVIDINQEILHQDLDRAWKNKFRIQEL